MYLIVRGNKNERILWFCGEHSVPFHSSWKQFIFSLNGKFILIFLIFCQEFPSLNIFPNGMSIENVFSSSIIDWLLKCEFWGSRHFCHWCVGKFPLWERRGENENYHFDTPFSQKIFNHFSHSFPPPTLACHSIWFPPFSVCFVTSHCISQTFDVLSLLLSFPIPTHNPFAAPQIPHRRQRQTYRVCSVCLHIFDFKRRAKFFLQKYTKKKTKKEKLEMKIVQENTLMNWKWFKYCMGNLLLKFLIIFI